jgi:Ca2+/Na+ antiporter
MTDKAIYLERISSRRTTVLFIALTIAFFLPFIWFGRTALFSGWSIFFFCLSAIFLFYTLNYRTLIINISEDRVSLQFGIFKRKIPFDNIENCFLDTSVLPRSGGAGIHFMFIQGRYTAMFNFIEYDRVVVSLKICKGPVRDIAFSSRQPGEVMGIIKEKAAINSTPDSSN